MTKQFDVTNEIFLGFSECHIYYQGESNSFRWKRSTYFPWEVWAIPSTDACRQAPGGELKQQRSLGEYSKCVVGSWSWCVLQLWDSCRSLIIRSPTVMLLFANRLSAQHTATVNSRNRRLSWFVSRIKFDHDYYSSNSFTIDECPTTIIILNLYLQLWPWLFTVTVIGILD